MTHRNPDTGPTQPSNISIPIGAIIGIVVLAFVGGGMLVYALLTLFNAPGASPTATTVAQGSIPTPAIIIPTVTSPPPTVAPTLPPATDTSVAPAPASTDTPAPPAAPVLNITSPANVRSGPGTNYAVIGGLNVGATAAAVGRDASAQWYVIDYLGSQGWVSNIVSQYTGDTNALPVVQAPPTPIPPPPTSTPVPPTPVPVPTNTPATGSAHGIRGDYFTLESSAREYAVNQDIWFKFSATNTSGATVPYRCLGAKVVGVGAAQCSWGNSSSDALKPNDTIVWNDHINIGTPGTYTLALGICYLNSPGECRASVSAGWEVLSSGIQVTIK
jgi:hypothetical protein